MQIGKPSENGYALRKITETTNSMASSLGVEEEDEEQVQDKTAELSGQVFVKTPTGKTMAFEVLGPDTVLSLKQKVEDETGYPLDTIRLLFAGRQLEDEQFLADCGIRKASIVHLNFRNAAAGGSDGGVSPASTDTVSSSSSSSWVLAG